MTVYVVHEVKDDIAPACKFGELRYINRFYIHGDELEQAPDFSSLPAIGDYIVGGAGPLEPQMTRGLVNVIPRGYLTNMERCRSEFRFGQDYLLIAGDHLQLLALVALLVGKRGFIDVLRWDRQLRDYIPVRLSSGIVPPRASMLVSGTDIGETDAESRYQEREARRLGEALALDGPHRPRRKPPAQDDH